MSKEYFQHDYHSRSELRQVAMKHGMEGIGIYWCLAEILHESGGYIDEDKLDAVTYELHCNEEVLKAIIYNYNLFEIADGRITAKRVLRNLKRREEISEARKKAVEKRWEATKEPENEPVEEEEQMDEEMGILPVSSPQEAEIKATEDNKAQCREWKEWFAEKFDKQEELAEKDLNAPIWVIRDRMESILDLVEGDGIVIVNGHKMTSSDYMSVVSVMMHSSNGMEAIKEAFDEVDRRCRKRKVSNKKNYTASAIYNAAKLF